MRFDSIWAIFLAMQTGLDKDLSWLEVANLILKENFLKKWQWKVEKQTLTNFTCLCEISHARANWTKEGEYAIAWKEDFTLPCKISHEAVKWSIKASNMLLPLTLGFHTIMRNEKCSCQTIGSRAKWPNLVWKYVLEAKFLNFEFGSF